MPQLPRSATIALLLAVTVYVLIPPPIPDAPPAHLSGMNQELSSAVPPALYTKNERVLGRWRGGVANPVIANLSLGQYAIQHKEWQWFGISDGSYLLGVAVGQLHYVSTAFIFVLDSISKQSMKAVAEVPLGGGAYVAEGLDDNARCTTFESVLASAVLIEICRRQDQTSIECTGRVNSSLSIGGSISIMHGADDTFSMAYPVADRSRYTHKAGGWSAQGSITVGDKKRAITQGLAMGDFTRGLFPRHTLWFWVSFAATVNGHRFALQLSDGLYLSPEKRNLEALLWLDGKLHELLMPFQWLGPLGGKNLWAFGRMVRVVQSANDNGDALSLYYTPLGSIHANKHLWILEADLHHTFGVYSGHVVLGGEKFVIAGAPGVFEDHDAWW